MKKTVYVLIVLSMLFVFTSCGSASDADEASKQSSSISQEAATEELEVVKTEKSIDAVADALGLTDKSEVYFGVIGAEDGAEFNGGSVELYIFDEASEDYQTAIDGTGMIQAAAYKDGVVLCFPSGTEPDPTIVDAFNALEF